MIFFSSISLQDRVDFTKSLAIMLKSGITINQALTELAEQSESTRFKKVIFRVRTDIENGTPLSVAFGREEKIFGKIFVSLIKAGEESGTLQSNLQFLSDWLSRSADLNREVSAATMYPKLVFGAAVLLGGSLAVFILPKLIPLFTSLKVELPMITKMLLAISLWVQSSWLLGIFLVFFLIVGVVLLNRIHRIRKIFHFIFIHLPFMGGMLMNYQRALVSQLFGTLLKSGLSLNDSASIVSGAVTNIYYQDSIKLIHDQLIKGTTLSLSMRHFGRLFPNMMISVVSIGENSGSLVQSFEYLAEFYSKEVSTQAKKLPTVIEPVLLVLIAVIVGFVALAIIMPIYELTGSL